MYYEYIEKELSIYYKQIKDSKIKEIIKYSLDGGKCIRGFIVKHLIETLTNKPCELWQPIVAIELIQGVSLVIDDLPCMDNDLIRRNKPSTFARYGERQALLTSLYGMNEAFHLLFQGMKIIKEQDKINLDSDIYINMMENILTNWNEFIGKNLIVGQMLDLKENIENLININIPINNINIIVYKTCSLFIFSFILGGIYSNKSINLDEYKLMGYYFGIMFQIMDDSNDIESDSIESNIVLSQGKQNANLLYLESKSKLLDLLKNNNIVTSELMNLINIIDNMLKL
jgi:geranylgeranyl pyrophosphate synthase